MIDQASRYPLTWPPGWDRTPANARTYARFRSRGGSLTIGDAVRRLALEMRRLGVPDDEWFISSNIRPRIDGLPSDKGGSGISDPGVAVYFRLFTRDQVLACDAWRTSAENIASIAAHVEALRAIDRYKVGRLEQAFTGYVALPAKGETWRSTLGYGPTDMPTRELITIRYRELARYAHPDIPGGSQERMQALNEAKASAFFEIQS